MQHVTFAEVTALWELRTCIVNVPARGSRLNDQYSVCPWPAILAYAESSMAGRTRASTVRLVGTASAAVDAKSSFVARRPLGEKRMDGAPPMPCGSYVTWVAPAAPARVLAGSLLDRSGRTSTTLPDAMPTGTSSAE